MEEKEEKAKWHPIVLEVMHKDKEGLVPFPIFCWSFGLDDKGKRVGALSIWSFGKIIAFNAKEKINFPVCESDNALEALRPYGWEKPPYFDEICSSINELREFGNNEEAKNVYNELKQKWEAML